MRRFWWGLGATTLAAAGGLVPVQVSASAQAAPTLEVSPLRVDPQEVVTFTVRDCPTAPELHVGESDFIRLIEPMPGSVAGTWSSELPAGLTDWTVRGTCGAVRFDAVVVDIDHPLMAFLPIGDFAPVPDPPDRVYGSDCPDDTVATVTFEDEEKGFRDTQTAPIDERGDWQVSPGYPGVGQQPAERWRITVRASCGEVIYAPLEYDYWTGDPPISPPPTSTTTSPTVPSEPTGTEPPPAEARPGRPSFTG